MTWNYTHVSFDERAAKELSRSLGLHPIIARILSARGIHDPDAAEKFLHPSLEQLYDPFLMRDMDRAVGRMVRALRDREKILIHGDFDTDGLTATAILVRTLQSVGAEASHYIPNRLKEGYGLQRNGVEIARRRNATLLITCDCGISSSDAVQYAKSLGIDTIITDHHQPESDLPKAVAVVNPHRPDCTYPFKELAGVGVAMKLILAFLQRCGLEPQMPSLLRMTALGTVADVVPLIDENRIIAFHGLALMPGTPSIGFLALMDVAGLGQAAISAYDVGYRLAPRINAMGRFGRQDKALELFFTRSRSEAGRIAKEMNQLNSQRQLMVKRMVEQAIETIESDPSYAAEKAIVVGDQRWHRGIVGIVASKLVEIYHRPALVVAIEDGVGFGSGRSIPEFHLLDGLSTCEDILTRYGGHAMAAGFELPASRLADMRSRFAAKASETLTDESLQQQFDLDAEVDLSDLDERFEEQFKLLEPMGYGNSAPLFRVHGVRLISKPVILKERHAKLQVDGGERNFTALAWGMADEVAHFKAGQRLDMIISLKFNTWRGEESLQLDIKALRPGGDR